LFRLDFASFFNMTSIRRKLKRIIRPPKRYEDSISSNKRSNSDLENSSDENSKGVKGKNELEPNDTCSQQDLETGEIDAGVKEINDEKKKELNEKQNDKKCNVSHPDNDGNSRMQHNDQS
ncbi:hypothetical protein Tco_1036267, partial [Tanacetum coccineum]